MVEMQPYHGIDAGAIERRPHVLAHHIAVARSKKQPVRAIVHLAAAHARHAMRVLLLGESHVAGLHLGIGGQDRSRQQVAASPVHAVLELRLHHARCSDRAGLHIQQRLDVAREDRHLKVTVVLRRLQGRQATVIQEQRIAARLLQRAQLGPGALGVALAVPVRRRRPTKQVHAVGAGDAQR